MTNTNILLMNSICIVERLCTRTPVACTKCDKINKEQRHIALDPYEHTENTLDSTTGCTVSLGIVQIDWR